MLSKLIKFITHLLKEDSSAINLIFIFTPTFIRRRLGVYPITVGNEILEIQKVLRTPFWLQSNTQDNPHKRLEEFFVNKTKSKFAIAVNSGGTAIQMSLRCLGLDRTDEVIHQVDTCVATPFSVLNAQVCPIFHDTNNQNFLLDLNTLDQSINSDTKAIIATHMWGDPEDLSKLRLIASTKNIFLIEDACLAFGTEIDNTQIGGGSTLGIFSFGSTKSVQAGGGGIIVTDDESLALELSSMRNWGDRTLEFGKRDAKYLSWNGKISEITAALALEQVKNFHKTQNQVVDNVYRFENYLKKFEKIKTLSFPHIKNLKRSYNQLRLNLEFNSSNQKNLFVSNLRISGVEVYDGNFEPLPVLSFFKEQEWKKWIDQDKSDRLEKNYNEMFSNANNFYQVSGIGIHRNNFLSNQRLKNLIKTFTKAYLEIL
jgi:perosamine synthetase